MAKDEAKEKAEQDVVALLRQAAEQMNKAAEDKEGREAALKEVENTLSRVNTKDAQELADSPIVQAFLRMVGTEDLQPGEARNKGTLAERGREWSIDDMIRQFELVRIFPIINKDITWNGVGPFRLQQGVPMRVPQPIADEYERILTAMRQADVHIKYIMNKSNEEPDANYLTSSSNKLRALSVSGQGVYEPGKGLIYGAGEGPEEGDENG